MPSLPRPKSVLDDIHPLVNTGKTVSFSAGFRRILGIVIPDTSPNGTQRILVRGTQDPENEAIVEAAAQLSRAMTVWLKANTMIVEDGGVIYGHGPPTMADIVGKGPGPQFGPIDVNGNILTGKIEQKRNPRLRAQGDPLVIYRKHVYIKFPGTVPVECKPLAMGRGWL